MATAFDNRCDDPAITGQCDCEGTSFAVRISQLCVDGCVLEADEDWVSAGDFLHVQIARSIEMNGRLAWAQGRRAQMHFFGQVHPAAISKLLEDARR